MSFANLKRNGTNLSALVEKANEMVNGGGQNKDDRFWYPQRDKTGNGYAVVRFLPGLKTPPEPWARYWDHAFKGPTGQWYIEKSLTSIGKQDAIAELNSKMWNSGIESDKDIVRKRKRQLRFVANVLIISDPANPENEGQVKLYRFGKKIMDKILDAINPKFPDEKSMDPFSFWEGADFVIKIRNVEGYPNYDASAFKTPSELFNGDDVELEKIYNKQFDLSEWTDPSNYKSYDELKARLALVLGESSPRTVQQEVTMDKMEEPTPMPTAESMSLDDDDDTMSYFAKLANDD